MPARPLLLMLLVAATAAADSPDGVEYRIVREGKVVPERRDQAGKKTLIISVKFRVEKTDGKPAGDIRKDHIRITENGKPVSDLELVQPRSVEPLTVVLVTDTSGSMSAPADDGEIVPKIDALRESASNFVRDLPPGTRLVVLPFSTNVARPESFTDRKEELVRRIGLLRADGETALFDAVLTAVQTLEAANLPGRRAVVTLTDGVDNMSRHRKAEVIERAREANVPLHMIGFGRDGDFDRAVMEDMAKETGGKFLQARNAKDLQMHFRQLSEDLQPNYTATFPSLFQDDDGTARNIEITIVRDGRTVSGRESFDYQVHGVVVPKMDQGVYLGLLLLIGVLLAVPAGFKRLQRLSGG